MSINLVVPFNHGNKVILLNAKNVFLFKCGEKYICFAGCDILVEEYMHKILQCVKW